MRITLAKIRLRDLLVFLAICPQRQQLIAENVIQTMLRMYPNYANDGSSVLIGITGQDIYPLGASWRFCFGWRVPESRSAIVSTARMNLEYPDEPLAEATLEVHVAGIFIIGGGT